MIGQRALGARKPPFAAAIDNASPRKAQRSLLVHVSRGSRAPTLVWFHDLQNLVYVGALGGSTPSAVLACPIIFVR